MTHVAYSSRWGFDRQYLAEHEPDLALEVGEPGGHATISGTVWAPRLDGRLLPFELAFRYPGQDPYEPPDVHDAIGRFPREADRHIEVTGRLCLWLPVAAPLAEFRRPGGLGVLLDHTRAFLTRQLTYESRERHRLLPYWTGPEWAHGTAAYTDWAHERLEGLTGAQIGRLLRLISGANTAGGRACPCGSKRRFGRCHRSTVETLRHAWSDPAARAAVLQLREERRRA